MPGENELSGGAAATPSPSPSPSPASSPSPSPSPSSAPAAGEVSSTFNMEKALSDLSTGLGFEEKKDETDVTKVTDVVNKLEQKPAAPAAPIPPAPGPDDAPNTWDPESKALWATLPAALKNQIIKREGDMFKGIESYKAAATYGNAMRQVMSPYDAIHQAQGIDPVHTVGSLLQSHHTLASGTDAQKVALLGNLVKSYRISPEMLGQALAPAGEPPYVDPTVKALQTDLDTVKSQLTARERADLQREQADLQREQARVLKQVDMFAADPKNIYFPEVAEEAAVLIRSGVVGTLEEAYEAAVWKNPVTRAKEIARIASDKAVADAKVITERTAAAKSASAANVTTTAKPGRTAAPAQSMDETLEEELRAIRARG